MTTTRSYDAVRRLTGIVSSANGAPAAGQQFDHAFDHIGNRTGAARDGRVAGYTPSPLSQHTSRTVPGFVNVLGEAL